MDKDSTQDHIYDIKNKDLLHINDVIFKDSIQSAITPNLDMSSLPSESPISSDVTSLDTLIAPIRDAQSALDTDTLKASPTLNSISFDENIPITETALKSKDDFQTNDLSTFQGSYSVTSSKKVDQNHVQFLKDLEKIPDRMAFKISEVSDLTGIKSYVLRYWESEFEQLKPKKAINNRRMYTQKDVTTILLIKKLLYEDKYSIEGAKKALKQLQVEVKKEHKTFVQSCQQQKAIDQLKELICSISSLKNSLSDSIEDQK